MCPLGLHQNVFGLNSSGCDCNCEKTRHVHFDGFGLRRTAALILKALPRPAPVAEIHLWLFCVVSLVHYAIPTIRASLLDLITSVLLRKRVSNGSLMQIFTQAGGNYVVKLPSRS